MNIKEIKRHALDSLEGNWIIAIFGSFIASFLGGIEVSAPSINLDFGGTSTEGGSPEEMEMMAQTLQYLLPFIITVTLVSFGISIALFIIGSAVSVGYAEFNMMMVEGVKPDIHVIFSSFYQINTAVLARLLVMLRVFLGTLLFIVPGIIASLKYAMTHYVIADNPGITAREALRESERLMDGNKRKFFCLGLSFIGWYLLVVVTFGIAAIWIVPYEQAAIAEFYNRIKRAKLAET